jgi:hypothetical protein
VAFDNVGSFMFGADVWSDWEHARAALWADRQSGLDRRADEVIE